MARISVQLLDYPGYPDERRRIYAVEPLEELDDGGYEEGYDYEDRRHFSTKREAVSYARALVKEYKERGDDAYWNDSTG